MRGEGGTIRGKFAGELSPDGPDSLTPLHGLPRSRASIKALIGSWLLPGDFPTDKRSKKKPADEDRFVRRHE